MSSQTDHFTRSARLALSLSQEEALRLNNAEIGPEHLLLAFARLEDCVAMQVLRSLGVEPGQLARTVDRAIDHEQIPPSGPLSLAPQTEQVLQAASEAARDTGSVRIGTGHLLLGMEHTNAGVAVQALRGLGVDLDTLRTRTEQMMAEADDE
jgi:ATP-dependent Clp protease ATP-binding subunit ClpC